MISAEFLNDSTTTSKQKDTRLIINPSGGVSYVQVGDLDSDVSFAFDFSKNEITTTGQAGTYVNNYLVRIIGCIPL